MTQTYSQLVARLNGSTFQDQCLYSVLFLMRWISQESDQTPDHANRLNWLHAAMADPVAMSHAMSNMVITDGNCNGDIDPTDSQIESALEALVNVYSI